MGSYVRSVCCVIAVAHQTTYPCSYIHICEKMRLMGEWSPRPQSEGLKQHCRALPVRWVELWAPSPVQKITTNKARMLKAVQEWSRWSSPDMGGRTKLPRNPVCVLHVNAHMHTCSSVYVYTCVMSYMTMKGQSQCWVFLSHFPLHALERISCGNQSSPIHLV